MKAASEPFTRSYLSPTMFTCLFLSRCIDWHQVCPALISSFSRRNQTAFPLTLLFVIDQHSFNARATPYSILIRSIPPLLQQQFTPVGTVLVKYLSHLLQEPESSIYKPSNHHPTSLSLFPFRFFPLHNFANLRSRPFEIPTLAISWRFVSHLISKKSL